MTVAELIAQLKAMPQHAQVKTYLETVYAFTESHGEFRMELDESDATPVMDVKNWAAYVLIAGE